MLRFLLEKEFKQFARNSFVPRLILIFPLMVTLVFPLVATFDVRNIYVTIIDHDKSTYSANLVERIEASGYFILTNVAGTYEEGLHTIEDRSADLVLEIPANFEQDLVTQQMGNVMISANAVNGNKGGLGTSYLASIVRNFGEDVGVSLMGNHGTVQIPFLTLIPRYQFNPELVYHVYMIPALMIMVLAMICGFLPALNIVSEKEAGTIEQMNVTPVKKFSFIVAKLIPYWLAGYVALTVAMVIARLAWGLIPVGSVLIVYVFATAFILAFSGFGLVISNYAASVQQAMFMMFFFVITFVFMSGLYTPVENMPNWAQWISHFSPLKYIIQVLRNVYLKGSTFFDLLPQLYALLGFAVFFNGWAILSYRKSS